MDDINCVSRALDWEKICLHPKDEVSFRKWIDVLRLEGANTFCKDKIDRASLRSGLSEDAFCLVLRTRFQSEMFQELRNALMPLTTPLAILGCPCLQLWQGTTGDMVSNILFWVDQI